MWQKSYRAALKNQVLGRSIAVELALTSLMDAHEHATDMLNEISRSVCGSA